MPCLSTNGWDRVFCRGSIQFCHWVWLQRLWNLRNQKLSGSLLKFWHWQPRSQHHLFSEQRPPSRPQGGLFSQQMLEAWFHWFPSMRSRCKLTCQPLIIYIYYVYVSILRSRYTIICNYIYNIYIYISCINPSDWQFGMACNQLPGCWAAGPLLRSTMHGPVRIREWVSPVEVVNPTLW